jgi:hypothetical protein
MFIRNSNLSRSSASLIQSTLSHLVSLKIILILS